MARTSNPLRPLKTIRRLIDLRANYVRPDRYHLFMRGGPQQPFERNHETFLNIRKYLEEEGHNESLAIAEILSYYPDICSDDELLRLLIEHGADPSGIDGRVMWEQATQGVLKRSALFYFVDVLQVDSKFIDGERQFPTLSMDLDLLRYLISRCGELPRNVDFSRCSLSLSPSVGLIEALAAMVPLRLSSAEFFTAAAKELLVLRGAEPFLLSLAQSGLWQRSRSDVLKIAARHGHLQLLRFALLAPDDAFPLLSPGQTKQPRRVRRREPAETDAVRLSRKEVARETATLREAALSVEDNVRIALLGTDRVDVLQLLVSEFGASLNTMDSDGTTVLHTVCRSAAAHARETLRWLLTETDFLLVDSEHCEDGTALDLAFAGLQFELVELLLHFAYQFPLPLTKKDIKQRLVLGLPLVGYVCSRSTIPESSVTLCVSELLRRGAKIDMQDSVRGDTPLMHAVRKQRWDLAKQLVRCNDASLHKKNKLGETALSIIPSKDENERKMLAREEEWRAAKKARSK